VPQLRSALFGRQAIEVFLLKALELAKAFARAMRDGPE
jgi:hypothetical protein